MQSVSAVRVLWLCQHVVAIAMYAIVPFLVFCMLGRDQRVTKQLFARTAPQSEQQLPKASPTRTRSRATHDEHCRRVALAPAITCR